MSSERPARWSGTVAAVRSERLLRRVVGGDQAGDEADDADVVGREVERERAGEGLDAALGGVVGGHAAMGAGGAAGGGGDDHAAAVAGHVVGGGDRAQVVAAQVGGDHAVEELDVGLEHVLDRVADLAGVAEHHVQAAEGVERRCDQRVDLVLSARRRSGRRSPRRRRS